MKLLLNLVGVVLFVGAHQVNAQNDTSYTYYNKNWDTCHIDTATYISKTYVAGNRFARADFWIKEQQLQSLSYSSDAEGKNPVDTATWYNKEGLVIKFERYAQGRAIYTSHYYPDGSRRAEVTFSPDGKINTQKGWDEAGNAIPSYIYEQEARFPGGANGWRTYLVSKINPKTAAKAKAPLGVYTVKVQFMINKEGKVEQATAVSVPPECSKCGVEAVKIIMDSPRWEHAIQFGKPVIYRAIQHISWEVAD